MHKHTCKQCGKIFENNRKIKKFCSLTCSTRAQMKRTYVKCQNCNKEFYVRPNEVEMGYGKFCSKECVGISRRTMINTTCLNCGKTFLSHISAERKFCSLICASTYQSITTRKKHDEAIKNVPELIDFIDGLIMSDASYCRAGKGGMIFTIAQCHKYKEWINYIEKKLNSFGIETNVRSDSKKITVHTPLYSLFIEQEKRWYYNYGGCRRKMVPKDLVLTPQIVLNWFLGDGTSSWEQNGTRVGLCTQGFSYDEILDLAEKLELIGIKARISRQVNDYIICISRASAVRKFYEYIGTSPVRCFNYKWKIPKCEGRDDCRVEGQLADKNYVLNEIEVIKNKIGHIPNIDEIRHIDAGLFFGIYRYHGGYNKLMSIGEKVVIELEV